MTVELKPCPFCGAGEATDNNNASFSGVELMVAGADRPYVWCGTCCASARIADTEAEAIAAWNTRSINPAAIREKALRKAVQGLVEVLDQNEMKGPLSDTALMFCWLAAQNIRAVLRGYILEKPE